MPVQRSVVSEIRIVDADQELLMGSATCQLSVLNRWRSVGNESVCCAGGSSGARAANGIGCAVSEAITRSVTKPTSWARATTSWRGWCRADVGGVSCLAGYERTAGLVG